MHTRQTDTLTEHAGDDLHWLVMQSLKHQKWILAVVRGDFADYQVTDVMSNHVDLMVQYADYLNKGIIGSSVDAGCADMLERLRVEYGEKL